MLSLLWDIMGELGGPEEPHKAEPISATTQEREILFGYILLVYNGVGLRCYSRAVV